MGLFDELKAFIHSITTEDHYASYESRYKHSNGNQNGTIMGQSNGSQSRLNEISRLNESSNSFEGGSNNIKIGYRPGLKSNSDLPLTTFENGQPPLPSIDSLWDRIEKWIEEEYPELEDSLNDGVTSVDLNEFENDLGVGNLPEEFRQFYKRHDGQIRGGKPTGLFMGLSLLDLEGIIEEQAIWTRVSQRLEKQQYLAQKEGTSSDMSNNSFIGNQRSIPPNSIQPYYYQKGWITLMKDHIGNQIAMDLKPGAQGKWGQIIIFGRDFDTKLVIANSLTEFVFYFVQDLEMGNYQIDSNLIQEEMGFLGKERNDDYMIGDEDEDQGELMFYDVDNKEFGKSIKGKLSYIDVFKRRTLKKYGLTENFSTQFVPQMKNKKNKNSPMSSRNGSSVNLKPGSSSRQGTSSPLVSGGQFTVPKETIIDNKEVEGEDKVVGEGKLDSEGKADSEGKSESEVKPEVNNLGEIKPEIKPEVNNLGEIKEIPLNDDKSQSKSSSVENLV